MYRVEKSALVNHPAEAMFTLVDTIESYPQFLPWCGATELHTRNTTSTIATIHIDYHGIKQSFTTENDKTFPTLMTMRFKQGPFSQLEGVWRFTALNASACKVEFTLSYAFSNRVLEKAIAPVFHHIGNTFVDAFVRRADEVAAG
jgi:ribosome-associated toxin RatA of RatAB toxin-antitoxin module